MAKELTKAQNATNKKLSFNSASSDRILLILEYIALNGPFLRLQDIATGLSMSQSTVLRYLNSLINMGYLCKNAETMRYSLTLKVCRLSHQLLSQVSIRDIVSPFLRELSFEFESGASLAKMQNDELLYLDVMYHPYMPIGSLQRIGKNAPMHVTGSGKLFLAAMSDEELSSFVMRKGLPELTQHTITDLPSLTEELQSIREKGYAIDNEECELGIRCVSIPLFDYSDKVVAAMSVFSPSESLSVAKIESTVVPKLKEIAAKISFMLGAQ